MIDISKIPNTLDDAIDIALKNNTKILEQKQIISEKKEFISQKSSVYLPTLKLNLNASYDDDLDSKESKQKELNGKLSLSWNFYNGGKDTILKEQAWINYLKEKKILEYMRKDIVEEISNLYFKYQNNKKRVNNLRLSIKNEKKILNIIAGQLEDGTKTFIDMLKSNIEMIDLQSKLIIQEFKLYDIYYKLLKEFSLLTNTMLSSDNQICKMQKIKNLVSYKSSNNDLKKLEDDLELNNILGNNNDR
jgi:adhesin transport system outer membrane protein